MQIIVIVGFGLTLSMYQVTAQVPTELAGYWFAPALCVYMLGMLGLKWWETSLVVRAAGSSSAGRPGLWRMRSLSILCNGWLLLGPPTLILLGMGPWINYRLGLAEVPLAGELVALVPFAAGLLVHWILEYPMHLLMRRRAALMDPGDAVQSVEWTLGQYVAFQVRTSLLFVAVPVGIILLLVDCIEMYLAPALDGWAHQDATIGALVTISALGVFLVAPPLLSKIWKTSPLEPGPVREELEEMCRRMRLRYRRLLIWHSGGVIVNAAVMGLIGPLRYILLSDGMLRNMHPEQVKAIFAHEAEHIRRHHIFYAILFAVTTILLGQSLQILLETSGVHLLISVLVVVCLLLVVWGLGFGWLSRRFERQCDVAAAWSCGPPPEARQDPQAITPEGAAVFAGALDQVARLNRMSRNKFNWRHGSISWRVAYVLHLGATRSRRAEIDRLVRRIQNGLWIGFGASVAFTWWMMSR